MSLEQTHRDSVLRHSQLGVYGVSVCAHEVGPKASQTNQMFASAVCSSGTLLQRLQSVTLVRVAFVHHHRERADLVKFLGLRRGTKANRHFREEWRVERGRKILQIVLPLDGPTKQRIQSAEHMNPAIMRAQMLKSGARPLDLRPSRPWAQKQISASSASELMDPYEGPGNSFVRTLMNPREMTWSKTTAAAAKLIARQNARSKKKLMKHVKEYDEYEFGTQARDLFIRANEALRDYDDETLRQLTTPYAYKAMRSAIQLSTLYWRWERETAQPKFVQYRFAEIPPDSGNLIVQVTVRFESEQVLAIYDQFGHLKLGDEKRATHVIDNVVFERQLSAYGKWRVHALVFPADVPPRAQPLRTRFARDEDGERDAQLSARRVLDDSAHNADIGNL